MAKRRDLFSEAEMELGMGSGELEGTFDRRTAAAIRRAGRPQPALDQKIGGDLGERRRQIVEDEVNPEQFDNRTASHKLERLGAAHRIITGRDIDASQQDVGVKRRLMATGSKSQLQDRRAEGTAWLRGMAARYGHGGV